MDGAPTSLSLSLYLSMYLSNPDCDLFPLTRFHHSPEMHRESLVQVGEGRGKTFFSLLKAKDHHGRIICIFTPLSSRSPPVTKLNFKSPSPPPKKVEVLRLPTFFPLLNSQEAEEYDGPRGFDLLAEGFQSATALLPPRRMWRWWRCWDVLAARRRRRRRSRAP